MPTEPTDHPSKGRSDNDSIRAMLCHEIAMYAMLTAPAPHDTSSRSMIEWTRIVTAYGDDLLREHSARFSPARARLMQVTIEQLRDRYGLHRMPDSE